MSYNLEYLKKMTEELTLRDQTLKESLLFLTHLPIAVLAVNEKKNLVFSNEKAKEKINAKKRRLETSEISDPENIQKLIEMSNFVFVTSESIESLVDLYDETFKVIISPVFVKEEVKYALIILDEYKHGK